MAKKSINDTADDGDLDDKSAGRGEDSFSTSTDRAFANAMDVTGVEGEEVEVLDEDEEDKQSAKEDSDGDERLSKEQRSEEDPEEERRRLNRERRKEAKERQRRAKTRDKTELNFLRSQNESLERRLMSLEHRQVSTEVHNHDSQIEQEEARLLQADTLLGQAVAAQSAEDVTKLTQLRDRIRDRIHGLKGTKARFEQAIEASRGSGEAGEEMHPVAKANAMTFFNRHRSWYDPSGRDRDSMMVYALDNEVLNEGYDPKTREYWEELESRMKESLPHRFKGVKKGKEDDLEEDDADEDLDDDQEDEESSTQQKRQMANKKNGSKGPRMSNGGNGAAAGGAGKFYLTPERKKALMDHGVWDDPVLRNKYIKRYAAYDREQAAIARR